MSKYKVGDKVTIRQWDDMKKEFGLNTLGIIACKAKFTNSMREFCGKTIVIDEVLHSGNYMIKNVNWVWSDDMFEPVKDMSNTTIQEYLDKLRESFSSTKGSIICGGLECEQCREKFGIESDGCPTRLVGLDNEAVKKVMAYQTPKKPILDDSEKKYLESALRPFKDRIGYIAIINWADGKACHSILRVRIDPEEPTYSTNSMSFPPFDEGTMYKGMEIDKRYTPEELGLWR
jgi:hypothetical protein